MNDYNAKKLIDDIVTTSFWNGFWRGSTCASAFITITLGILLVGDKLKWW